MNSPLMNNNYSNFAYKHLGLLNASKPDNPLSDFFHFSPTSPSESHHHHNCFQISIFTSLTKFVGRKNQNPYPYEIFLGGNIEIEIAQHLENVLHDKDCTNMAKFFPFLPIMLIFGHDLFIFC